MDQPENLPAEPEEPSAAESKPSPKGRQSLSKVRRELTDEELSSPAVQRMLIDEIERLERDNFELTLFRDRFHASDKRVSVLEAQSKKSIAGEIIFGVCLTVGAAAVGYAPSLWAAQPSGWIALIFGASLLVGGIASRVVQR